MSQLRFTQQEAQRLLGRLVRSLTDLSVVPKGTTGRVVSAEEILSGEFELVVEWDLHRPGQPDREYFTRDQFDRCLVEA
ncbi:MAG TPA: hypothetical protein VFQ92_22555 [Blastocatellia bacterium]|nr:hypothetical protein [Blastocatellia bacterium]